MVSGYLSSVNNCTQNLKVATKKLAFYGLPVIFCPNKLYVLVILPSPSTNSIKIVISTSVRSDNFFLKLEIYNHMSQKANNFLKSMQLLSQNDTEKSDTSYT